MWLGQERELIWKLDLQSVCLICSATSAGKCILILMEDWKEWREVSPGLHDAELPRDQAWRMISDWKAKAKEIGVVFVSQLHTLRALATVKSAVNGTIQL
jgi:hypothetical protein